jgi:hypothetical protein
METAPRVKRTGGGNSRPRARVLRKVKEEATVTKPEDNQKATNPTERPAKPKPPGQGSTEAPAQTNPNEPNDEVADPRAPG